MSSGAGFSARSSALTASAVYPPTREPTASRAGAAGVVDEFKIADNGSLIRQT
jgi:hypothetical protein